MACYILNNVLSDQSKTSLQAVSDIINNKVMIVTFSMENIIIDVYKKIYSSHCLGNKAILIINFLSFVMYNYKIIHPDN